MSIWFTPFLSQMLEGYVPLFFFLAVAGAIGCILTLFSWVLGKWRPDTEKLSPYECGFEPFGDLRGKFYVRFYLVAVLFILFDIEIVFLVPWAIAFGQIGFWGYISMVTFLFILTVGFIYEWRKGALEWE